MGKGPLQSLRGEVERVTFFQPESGFAVLRVLVEGRREPVTVTGRTAAAEAGEVIEAAGEWTEDPRFGRQFKAREIHLSAPTSRAGLVRFLGSGLVDGIGPVLAERLVDRFGSETMAVLDKASKRLEEVEGIGPKKRREIKSSWDRQRGVREIMLFLHDRGIPTTRALRIHREYGDEAREVLEKNPYRLAEDIFGIGFRTADDLASRAGMARDAPERLLAALRHVLRQAREQGHAALPSEELVKGAAALLETPASGLDPVLARALSDGHFVAEVIDEVPLVFLPGLRRREVDIVDQLKRLVGEDRLVEDSELDQILERSAGAGQGIDLGADQREAVRLVLRERFSVITGGPGVGKTTVLRCLLGILDRLRLGTVLAAPTGKAARRMTAASGREARTVHKLLGFRGEGGFSHGRGRRLAGDVFILDEVSMVDIPLMAALLAALPNHARLLLVGDADQLPSVGPGTVLADILAAGLPQIRLTEIYRQAGDSRIVTAAHEVHAGHLPDLDPQAGSDCIFLSRPGPEETVKTLVHLVRDRLPHGLGVDPLDDVQVLTPMNRGPLGTTALNKLLQEQLNPPDPFKPEVERFGTVFRRGDKVMQLRNNAEKDISNGDGGRITAIDHDPVRVWVRFEDGRLVDFDPGELDELRLAYAVTIHKSQGSEFPVVVVPLVAAHFLLLQRNLLYTAMTRGRRQVVLVGEERALRMAVDRAQATRRWGGLRWRLGQEFG